MCCPPGDNADRVWRCPPRRRDNVVAVSGNDGKTAFAMHPDCARERSNTACLKGVPHDSWRPSHAISTPDIERALAFYRDLLGLRVVFDLVGRRARRSRTRSPGCTTRRRAR